MASMPRFPLVLSLAALLLFACDDPPTTEDDAGVEDAGIVEIPPFETGDPDGHPEPLGAGPGESRAGRLTADQLPVDRTGLATWEAGDFVIANDRVALLIEDAGHSDLYDPHGGRPVGIARVEDGALVDAGDFNEIIFGFGSNLVATESVTVLNDGSDGQAAVVRAIGPLGPLEFAGELLAALLPGDFSGLPAALDYTMEPGKDAIDIHLEVQVPQRQRVRASMLVAGVFQRYRMPRWIEGQGFASSSEPGGLIAFIDDLGASYALLPGEGRTYSELLDQSGVLVYQQGSASAPAWESTRFHLGTMILGGNGLPGLQQAIARHRGETLRTVEGTVLEADGSPATDVRVHVRRADGTHFARLTPAEDGTFSVDVPNEDVSFFAFRQGMALVGPVDVAEADSQVELTMREYATVVVSAQADDGSPVPARVQLLPAGGTPDIPADLGELVHSRGRSHVVFTTTGTIELKVDPGNYQVITSRGYEFEIDRQEITVEAGEEAGEMVAVGAELTRAVDTTDVMCADFHIHTHRSPDSPDSPEFKLHGLIADGLEIAVRTDHEWVADFQPLIEEMGLEEFAFGIGGEELTTFAWGHFNVFPLEPDPAAVNHGAIPWVGRLPPAVFADVRARPERPALIINHPRGAALGAYFTAAGYDPDTNTASKPEMWDEEFTLVEVFNNAPFYERKDGEEVRRPEVRDWFGLLNGGRRIFAVGSSDSHGIWSSPVGYPRTCLAMGTDDPRELTANMVRDVAESGNSTVSGGIYLTVVGPDGAGPGEEVTGVGEEAFFHVQVQAACWISATELEVIVDGELIETIELPDEDPCDPMRLDTSLSAPIRVPVAPAGSWVVFHARGEMDLSPVHPGRMPFAVSNPVFLRR